MKSTQSNYCFTLHVLTSCWVPNTTGYTRVTNSPALTYCEFLLKNHSKSQQEKKVFHQSCSGAHCLSNCVEHASFKLNPFILYISHWSLHSIPHRAPFCQIPQPQSLPFTCAAPYTRRRERLNLYAPCFPPSFSTGYCQRWTLTTQTSGPISGAPCGAPHNSITSPAVTTQQPKRSSCKGNTVQLDVKGDTSGETCLWGEI